jgi:hypothetical protein
MSGDILRGEAAISSRSKGCRDRCAPLHCITVVLFRQERVRDRAERLRWRSGESEKLALTSMTIDKERMD